MAGTSSRAPFVAIFLAAAALVTAASWSYGVRAALEPLAARGRSDLALAADRLVTQLQRYREFAVLMADHPVLTARHAGGDRDAADRVLQAGADMTGSLSVVYADLSGDVLAASRGPWPQRLGALAFFDRARSGALGARLETVPARPPDDTPARRVFSYAAPHFGVSGRVEGVLVVSVDLARLEALWRGSLPTVYFTDETGSVVATNRSELLGWRRGTEGRVISPSGRSYEVETLHRAGHVIRRQDWSPYVPQNALYLTEALPEIGLDASALVDVAPARRLAALQAGAVLAVVLFFGALLFLATERRRALAAANAELESRVSARTRDLSEANAALRREVAERQEAEARLTRAQAELVQAGKLSALGKMSAGISHELNQPLMAIRSFAENGAAFLDRGRPERAAENFGRISEMGRRMGRIIQNLRLFARQESAPVGRVELGAVLQSAIELSETRLAREGVTLERPALAGPIHVRGGEVRLGQVFVNLISNAVETMAGQEEKRLTIRVEDGAAPRVVVADTGPGIEEPERLFDPFYSTKAVGEGMGLGLSISYGLVQSFGGTIRGENAADGGAVFTVELERWQDAEAA